MATQTSTLAPTQTPLPLEPISAENTAIPQVGAALSPGNADRVVPLVQWGKGNVQDIAYSPDGTLLGVASSLGVYLYDSLSLELVAFYPSTLSVTALQFSPDQETFAWGLANGQIEIRRVKDGALIQEVEIDPLSLIDLAYSKNGEQLISIQDDLTEYNSGGILFRWDLNEGKLISSNAISSQDSVSISDDGRTLAWKTASSVEIIDTISQNSQSIPIAGYSYSVKFSPDGETFLLDDGVNIFLRRVDQPADQVILSGVPQFHDVFYAFICHIEADGPGAGSLQSAAFSPDGNLLVLGAREGVIQIRRVSDGVILSSFSGWAERMVFAPDSQTFTLLPGDGTIQIRSAAGGSLIKELTGHTTAFTSAAFSANGSLFAAGATDERVRMWHVQDGSRALDLQTQANQVAFSPDGSLLATGSNYGGVILWDLSTGEKQVLSKDLTKQYDIQRINSMQFTPDGHSLIAGTQSCLVKVYDIASGRTIENIVNGLHPEDQYERNNPVISFAISSDSRILATNYDASVLALDLDGEKTLSPLLDEVSWPFRLDFFPEGNQIAIGSQSSFQVWDLNSSKQVYTTKGPASNLVVSPDGQLIATSDWQGSVYLWQAVDGEQLVKLEGHRQEITQLAFSPDGKYLASTSKDGTLRLWGVP